MIFGDKCSKAVTTTSSTGYESESEKLLGITFDKKLNKKLSFRKHLEELCKKANRNLNELCPLVHLFRSYETRQFSKIFHQVTFYILSTCMDVP